MATVLSTAIELCFTSQYSDTKKHSLFLKPSVLSQSRSRKLNISYSSLKQPKTLAEEPITTKTSSLSEQLKPLSATTLRQEQPNVLSKPKSVWVNPTRPKWSVLSLQRQKRSAYSYNPQIKDLRAFAQKLNSYDFTEKAEFLSILDEIPHPPNRDNACAKQLKAMAENSYFLWLGQIQGFVSHGNNILQCYNEISEIWETVSAC